MRTRPSSDLQLAKTHNVSDDATAFGLKVPSTPIIIMKKIETAADDTDTATTAKTLAELNIAAAASSTASEMATSIHITN